MRSIFEREPYLTERRILSDLYGSQPIWKTIDAWPLYVGYGNLARTLILVQAVIKTEHVKGDLVEFGAWRGSTTMLWAKTLSIFGAVPEKSVHAFDIWDGGFSPEQWTPADNPEAAARYAGTYAGELGVLMDMIHLYRLEPLVRLHRGKIEETWPALLAAKPDMQVSLALLDVDLYEPTKAALTGLHDRLNIGGVILADEYGDADWPGETQAVDEFLAAHHGCYAISPIHKDWAPQPTLWLTRIQ